MKKYEEMSPVERGIFWIEQAYDVRHLLTFSRHTDAKPDLLAVVEAAKETAGLRILHDELRIICENLRNENDDLLKSAQPSDAKVYWEDAIMQRQDEAIKETILNGLLKVDGYCSHLLEWLGNRHKLATGKDQSVMQISMEELGKVIEVLKFYKDSKAVLYNALKSAQPKVEEVTVEDLLDQCSFRESPVEFGGASRNVARYGDQIFAEKILKRYRLIVREKGEPNEK